MYDDPYDAGLNSSLCFAFSFFPMVMLMFTCEPSFTHQDNIKKKIPHLLFNSMNAVIACRRAAESIKVAEKTSGVIPNRLAFKPGTSNLKPGNWNLEPGS